MNPRKHALLTAWLGLVAMWLIVLAPLVSQLLAAHRAHDPDTAVVLCSAVQRDSTAQHLSPDDAFGACGYCHLLQHQAAITPLAPPELAATRLVTVDTVAALSTRFTPLGAFPSGRPRGPPAVS
ncbi:DUF2946 domain-containing protein [Paraburkholderia acidipaludis]|uniref:DUF2946 domain-containing protein n=1 Tax=Paraburkholderia acidipaludis TaxID=660537 RepID=UPI0004840487|nr:DUF2946 domain-containing protein [Paraburkholderia acidipaludis]